MLIYNWRIKFSLFLIAKVNPLKNRMSTDHAAQKILRAISRKRKICIPGVTAKLAAIMGTIAPRLTGRLMRKALLDKMDRVRT